MDLDNSAYLLPTPIVDSDHEAIVAYARDSVKDAGPDPVAKAVTALKHVLTLLYISYGFEDRKIFFFAKKGRQPNSDLIGLAWINL